jgi:hypothetical protein
MWERLIATAARTLPWFAALTCAIWATEANAQECLCTITRISNKIVCVPDPTCEDKKTGKRIFGVSPEDHTLAYDAGPVKVKILATAYDRLSQLGGEEQGYSLYSYAIAPVKSSRVSVFLGEILRSIPPIEDTDTTRQHLNIFYVPFEQSQQDRFYAVRRDSGSDTKKFGEEYSQSFYNYKLARTILDRICNAPPSGMDGPCRSDLSDGPYIFTYIGPASKLDAFPPPYLFVDFTGIRERAFGEVLSAFRAQVKSEDIAARQQIDALRVKVLNVVLTAADFVAPIEDAVAALAERVHGVPKK